MYPMGVLVVALSLPLAIYGAEPPASGLDGLWRLEKGELAGAPFPEEVRKTLSLEIAGKDYKVTAGESIDRGTVTIDATKTPKTLDIIGTEGPNKGKTFLAIYELEGDTLKVCYNLGGGSRPTEFKSPPQSLIFLAVYKRAKPAAEK